MASVLTEWSFTFSQGGRVSIYAKLDGVPDTETRAELGGDPDAVFDGVTKRFQAHPNNYTDAAAFGLVMEPKVEKLAPGVLTAAQKTQLCRAIAEIMWQYYVPPVMEPEPAPDP